MLVSHSVALNIRLPRVFARFLGMISPKMRIAIAAKPIPKENPSLPSPILANIRSMTTELSDAAITFAREVAIRTVINTRWGLVSSALNKDAYFFVFCAISLNVKRRSAVMLVSINEKSANKKSAMTEHIIAIYNQEFSGGSIVITLYSFTIL